VTDPAASNGPADAVRRAPFGTNPQVGTRGQRTRHRILDAALQVFGEVGLHQGSVERIATEAGCSRAAFYQYFSGKDDLLRHLAAQLSLHLEAAVSWLRPITPSAEGWASLRDLVERWAEIHARHLPVFDAFPALFDADPAFAEDASQIRNRFVSAISARVQASDLSPAAVDGTIDLFLVVFPRVFEDLEVLRRAAPGSFPLEPTLDLVTDVVHRSLFGLDEGVNVHQHGLPEPPRLPFGPLVRSGIEDGGRSGGDAATRAVVLEAARACFLADGFHGTRIDMIAASGGRVARDPLHLLRQQGPRGPGPRHAGHARRHRGAPADAGHGGRRHRPGGAATLAGRVQPGPGRGDGHDPGVVRRPAPER
jgi:AcrR family transcriptional regulator